MLCNRCGSGNPDQASFCGVCGYRMEPTRPLSDPNVEGPASPVLTSQNIPPTYPSYDVVLPASEMFNMPEVNVANATPYMNYSLTPQPTGSPVSDAGWPGSIDRPSMSPPPTAPSSRNSALAKPLPLWAFLGATVLVVGLFVVLELTGSDWAIGAMHVAVAASIIAVLLALLTGARILVGMAVRSNPKRVWQLVGAGVGVLLLVALALVGFTQQATIHSLQAHNFEAQQRWQSAINEFQLAGEHSPSSDNLARVNNEWGEQLTTQKRYEEAFSKFDTVITSFAPINAEVSRADVGKIKAYLDWAKQASDQRDFATATSRYDTLLQQTYCDSNCQTQASALDATAYYNLAESQLAGSQFDSAVTSFNIVVTRFPNSSEASKLHEDYAKSLFGQGQQQLTASCSSAIPTYQQLSSQFADTPEGHQAATALKAPQRVTGHFTGTLPQSSALTDHAALLKSLNSSTTSNQFFALLNGAPTATIQSNGSFTFGPVPQGIYDLAWGSNNTDGNQSYNSSFNADGSPAYVANVGSLCAFDFGDINQSVTAAP